MSKDNDWVRRDYKVRPSTYEELEKMKKKTGLTVSSIVRTAISKYVEENKK